MKMFIQKKHLRKCNCNFKMLHLHYSDTKMILTKMQLNHDFKKLAIRHYCFFKTWSSGLSLSLL